MLIKQIKKIFLWSLVGLILWYSFIFAQAYYETYIKPAINRYKHRNPAQWTPELRKEVEDYNKSVKAIDDSWGNLKLANVNFKMGHYEEAIEMYKKAYQIGGGNESFFGMELLRAYEKLYRYDEALALLDEIEKKYYKSEYGIQKAQEIRTRLLAAKNSK